MRAYLRLILIQKVNVLLTDKATTSYVDKNVASVANTPILTTNTLTVHSGALHIKIDLVLSNGIDNNVYINEPPTSISAYTNCFCWWSLFSKQIVMESR